MEKILRITEDAEMSAGKWESHYSGYTIDTDKRKISVMITDSQSCCEEWGYCASDDDLNDFIGANLLEVNITDSKLESFDFEIGYEGDAQFVTFVTDMGVFQLAVYNWHNGYYGHGIMIKSNDEVLLEGIL